MMTTLRWLAALLAVGLMICAGFLMYEAFFVLIRFGAMAIFQAIALWLAATVLWWLVAEFDTQLTRTRIGHIFIGAIVLGVIALLVSAIRARRLVDGIEMGLDFEAPLAFILGGTLGAFYSLLRLRGSRAI